MKRFVFLVIFVVMGWSIFANDEVIYAIKTGDAKALEAELKIIDDVNILIDNNGESLLFAAVRAGNVDIVNKLLVYGMLPDKAEHIKGMTPLMIAISRDDTEIARLIIASKANVNSVDFSNNTAIALAAEKGNTEIVKLLIEEGAYVDIKDKNGKNAISKALLMQNLEIAELLVSGKTSQVIDSERVDALKLALDYKKEKKD